MATMTQVKNGLMKYIDNEILPHLTGAKKIGLGVYTALAAENLEKTVLQYVTHPAIAMLEIIDSSGNVNVDRLYSAAAPHFAAGAKYTINIPLVGPLIIGRDDLDNLYRYIIN